MCESQHFDIFVKWASDKIIQFLEGPSHGPKKLGGPVPPSPIGGCA